MTPLFLGGQPAADFLNTVISPNGTTVEFIGDGAAFLAWLVEAGLLDADVAETLRRRFSAKSLDAAAAEAREVREWARRWIARWRVAPHDSYEKEFIALNRLLKRASTYRAVAPSATGAQMVERYRIESAEDLISLVATEIGLLVTTEDAALMKQCMGAGCSLCFLDRTKAHRRMFCSAALCGNRAKVAAFRERHRSA
ncbi:CGNR zinc finger domain-containing protein [Methylibium sp.]|uniref:CGNR zinc finger domain-containing protein n=1 Tax=Methylibium sp. TaxID=2067992 RepID=UPI003D0BB646